MLNLFEYQNKVPFDEKLEGLEAFLDEIWNNREKESYFDSNRIESQRFIQFIHKRKELKSNKYVGVIHFNGTKINLLPKIFYTAGKDYSEDDLCHIQNHILWWLSYCRKIKFPSYQSNLSGTKGDFFEVLIYLFSKYTRALLNNSIYQQYEEVNNELPYIKGRINTNKYINDNLGKGRWHKINCTYDAFVMDNQFNRIIKYVSTLLFNHTTSQDSKKNLREILFLLDEVSDVRATAQQCEQLTFNPMFGEFEIVRDYCKLFLDNCISFDYKNDLKLFAFMLPMEYVFEDFVFGFIQQELKDIHAKAQRSDTHLDLDKTFLLKPDLWISTPEQSFIADTKYKIVYANEHDKKGGISQTDLYQMIAYAIRFNVKKIILFYPNSLEQSQESNSSFTIIDQLANGQSITISAHQIPIINRTLMDNSTMQQESLSTVFESTKVALKAALSDILL